MNDKYILTDETIKIDGHVLHRIKAIKNFSDVIKGDLGGYIESDKNLSISGDAWIYDNAVVYGNAKVFDNAVVSGDAKVYGNAWVYGDAWVCGKYKGDGDMNMNKLKEKVALKYIDLDVKRDEKGFIKEVYLYLKYLEENERGMYEHKFENIYLPIVTDELPTLKPGSFLNFLLDIGVGDCLFNPKDHTVRVIEEKSKEMTLDEIERILGHKVKIVKEKGEK